MLRVPSQTRLATLAHDETTKVGCSDHHVKTQSSLGQDKKTQNTKSPQITTPLEPLDHCPATLNSYLGDSQDTTDRSRPAHIPVDIRATKQPQQHNTRARRSWGRQKNKITIRSTTVTANPPKTLTVAHPPATLALYLANAGQM